MNELINIGLRFALYLDLMLLFGVSLFGLYGLRAPERVSDTALAIRQVVQVASGLGVLLSVASLVVLTQAMSGAEDWQGLWPHLQMMLGQTTLGLSWMARIAALGVALIAALAWRRWPAASLWLSVHCGAVALITLVWTGHGVMHEGWEGAWHLLSDGVHLLAAAGWVGALAAFGFLLTKRSLADVVRVRILARALVGFEWMGTLFVALLLVTGSVNYVFVAGPHLDGITHGVYAILLCLKLVLFAVMLALAGHNRFHLTPFLQRSLAESDHQAAGRALRRSLLVEFGAALLILMLVSWLGTLAPEVDQALQ